MTGLFHPLSALSCLFMLLACGCSSDSSKESSGVVESDVVIGDLVEPFTPPSLAELIEKNQWGDREVVDFFERLRESHDAEWGEPELSAEEALALRNGSAEDNRKILQTLGRLAPADGSGVDKDAVIVRKANSDLKSSNPILQSLLTEQEYHRLTGLALVGYDKDFLFYADANIVTSWQTSEDNLVDVLKIRNDLTWSDGERVTAYDFEFAFFAIMTEDVVVPSLRQPAEQIKWVKAYDDQTLVFFHKRPLATNTANINAIPAIPKHVYEEAILEDPTLSKSARHSELEDNPITAGPYELVKRERGQEFVVRRREGWFMHEGKQVRSVPHFAEVRFKVIEDYNTALLALKNGQLDESEFTAEQWATQTDDADFYKKNTKITGKEWTRYYICWNMRLPLFEDKRVRKAMSYSLDYDEMLQTIHYGVHLPSRGTFHPDSWMFPENGPEPYVQDLDEAERLLDEAGWVDSDGDGVRDKEINGRRVPFRFTMLTTLTEASRATAILLKESLDQIGVEVIPKPTEFTVLVQKCRDKDFEAFLGAWITGADPDSGTNLFATGEMRNYPGYSNEEVDRLFDEGRVETDIEKRAAIYGQIHNLLWEDQPYTWLIYRNSLYGFSKRLRGYSFAPDGPYGYYPGFQGIHVLEAQP
ncbi:MAG: ABC transporter substrate-binding protein [Planctomycetota bacterium]